MATGGLGPLIPLQFDRVKPVDPLATYAQGQQVRALTNANDETEMRRAALEEYSQRQNAGDPNALSALNAHPAQFAQVIQARNQMDTNTRAKFDWDMGHRARFALAVLNSPRESQQAVYESGLKTLLQVGAINREQFSNLNGKPLNRMVLEEYAGMGGLDFIKLQLGQRAAADFAQGIGAGDGGSAPPPGGSSPAPPQAAPAQPAGAPIMAQPTFPPSPINPSPPASPGAPPGGPSRDLSPSAPPSAAPGAPVAAQPGAGQSAPVPPVAPPAPPVAQPGPAQAGGWPVAADTGAAPGGPAVVTPAAPAPVAPAGPQVSSEGAVTGVEGRTLAALLPGNPRLQQQLAAAERALANPYSPPSTVKLAEKIFDRASKELEATTEEKQYVADMKQRLALKDPSRPFMLLGDWLKDQNARKATNVSQIVEAEGNKKYAQRQLDRYFKAQEGAHDAAGTIRMYETVDKLLDNPDVYTGTAERPINELKKLGVTLLGINMQGVGAAEVARKITDELALQFKKSASDPQTSTYEAQVYNRMAVGLSESAEGRKLLVQLRINDLNYQTEVAKVFRKHFNPQTKEVDPAVDEALLELAQRRREKLGDFLERAQRVAQGQPQPGPTAGVPRIDPNAALDSVMKRITPGAQP